MGFVDRLRLEAVRVDPPWHTFEATIAGLAGCLADAGLLPRGMVATAVEAVMRREGTGSTALLDIATGVPHARLPGIPQALVALAVSPTGLYEAVPTVPIVVVALVLSPPDGLTDHLNILAGVATLLRSSELRARLMTATDGSAALAALREHARSLP